MTFILFPVTGPVRHVEAPGHESQWHDLDPFTPQARNALGRVGHRWWAWAQGTAPNPHAAALGFPHACGDILVSWDCGNGHWGARPGDEQFVRASVHRS